MDFDLQLEKKNIDRYSMRLKRLHSVIISFCGRWQEAVKFSDANRRIRFGVVTDRREQHRRWIQMIVLLKMYARMLDEFYDYVTKGLLRPLERERIKRNDPAYGEDLLEWTKETLQMITYMRFENGRMSLEAAANNRDKKLSPQEARAALSISECDWNKYCRKFGKRGTEMLELIFYGDKSLMVHIGSAAMHEVLRDDKTAKRLRLKMQSVFPALAF